MSPSSTEHLAARVLTPQEMDGYWSTRIHPWSYDFDYLGHLTAAIYPKAFEEGRVRYLAERWGTTRPQYVVASHRMEYLAEIPETQEPLRVLLRPVHLGSSSLRLEEALLDADGRLCNASLATLVAWNATARGPRPLTSDERSGLRQDLGLPGTGRPLFA